MLRKRITKEEDDKEEKTDKDYDGKLYEDDKGEEEEEEENHNNEDQEQVEGIITKTIVSNELASKLW